VASTTRSSATLIRISPIFRVRVSKAKCAALLEWLSGAVKPEPLSFKDIGRAPLAKPILQLFGVSGGEPLKDDEAAELGPTRLAFWDAPLNQDWRSKVEDDNNLLVEVKTENRIDRIRGVAEHPRQSERVPAGAVFDFNLSMKVLNIDGDGQALRTVLFRGLRLLELDSLGGSGSRGYGKVKFRDLQLDSVPVQKEFEALDPFSA
jgi:CRISPR-associated protein Csm3